MPFKTTIESPSQGPLNSASSLFDSDSFKTRRTSSSLSNLSPGSRLGRSKTISIQDLMGGEKKSTDIHSNIHSNSNRMSRSSLLTTLSQDSEPAVVHAGDKIQDILKARKTRQRRRSDISKSLEVSETMLLDSAPLSPSDGPDDMNNLTIPLNDVGSNPVGIEKEGGRRRRRNSQTNQCDSPKPSSSVTKREVTREERLRLLRSQDKPTQKEDNINSNSNKKKSFLTNNAAFSPKSPSMKRSGSSNTLRERLRQRLQGADYCNLNESTSDISHTGEGSTRVRKKSILASSDDDDCTGDESDAYTDTQVKVRSRSKSDRQRRARSKSRSRISRNQPDSGDVADSLKKPRSKSKSRLRDGSKPRSKSKRRPRQVDTETEEESSTASKSTSNRRGRQPMQFVVDETSVVSDANTDADCSYDSRSHVSSKSSEFTGKSPLSRKGRRPVGKNKVMDTSNSSTESPIVSPESKKAKKRSKMKAHSKAYNKSMEEEQSLGLHLESERSMKRSIDNDDLSQVTEERSTESSGPQTILLQFDPTNKNHVRSVNQNEAKKTSETIHGLHGTESRLEIAELFGLPTFEKFNTSGSTSTTSSSIHSLNNSSDHKSTSYLSTTHATPKTPKKKGFSRSSSYVTPSPTQTSPSYHTPGETPVEAGSNNAQWNSSQSHSSRQGRSIGNVGLNLQVKKNTFFKKGEVDVGDKCRTTEKKTSSLGGRTKSFGAMIRIGGRQKALRDCGGRGLGDGESLLASCS